MKPADINPDDRLTPVFARRPLFDVPKNRMPAGEIAADTAYEIIHDELMLDGNSRQNLATFVTTWMEPQAEKLMAETFDKNMVDRDEYPQTAEIERRCLEIVSSLWNSPSAASSEAAVGTSTVGSSEAAMLGGLAMKLRWRARRGRQANETPNLVMGINVQVCWEKFCRYWDVEPRFVPMDGDRFHLGVDEAISLCDENTIGVIGILGSTYDGSYEPITELAAALDRLQETTGLDIPMHVDGASGGFVAPFLQPNLKWDFRLDRVVSINASGHKFGLVYPGVGWIVWRDREHLPEDLVFYTNYLGGPEATMAINFSRPGSQVVAQYYNFIRLGHEGYRRIHQASQDVAVWIADQLDGTGAFEILTNGTDLPVLAFRLSGEGSPSEFDLSERYRDRGWQIPAYTFPDNRSDVTVLRIVCREGFSHDLAEAVVADTRRHLDHFAGDVNSRTGGFRH
jgi:glutamate decarboxylase